MDIHEFVHEQIKAGLKKDEILKKIKKANYSAEEIGSVIRNTKWPDEGGAKPRKKVSTVSVIFGILFFGLLIMRIVKHGNMGKNISNIITGACYLFGLIFIISLFVRKRK